MKISNTVGDFIHWFWQTCWSLLILENSSDHEFCHQYWSILVLSEGWQSLFFLFESWNFSVTRKRDLIDCETLQSKSPNPTSDKVKSLHVPPSYGVADITASQTRLLHVPCHNFWCHITHQAAWTPLWHSLPKQRNRKLANDLKGLRREFFTSG